MTTPVFVRNLISNTFEAKFGSLPPDAISIVSVQENSQGFNWRCEFNDNLTNSDQCASRRHVAFLTEQAATVRGQFPLVAWADAA